LNNCLLLTIFRWILVFFWVVFLFLSFTYNVKVRLLFESSSLDILVWFYLLIWDLNDLFLWWTVRK
jgi:hypothetical protein